MNTLVYTELNPLTKGSVEWVQLSPEGFLKQLLDDLYRRQIQSLIVEGGSTTIDHFVKEGLWDEARVFISDQTFEKGIPAPILNCKPQSETKMTNDRLLIYSNSNKWKS